MKDGRLHAYEVLLRVAKVREVRASSALAEASAEAHACSVRHDEAGAAHAVVAAAGRGLAAGQSNLDLARYELLSNLDALLAMNLETARDELDSADTFCRERALAAVKAKQYREKADAQVRETRGTQERTKLAGLQEEAIECWLRGRGR
ncbi:hypothetical protein ACVCL3_02770 [Rhodanobacter sp. UC4437_H4]